MKVQTHTPATVPKFATPVTGTVVHNQVVQREASVNTGQPTGTVVTSVV